MPGVAEHGCEIFRDIFDPAHLTALLRALEGPAIHPSASSRRVLYIEYAATADFLDGVTLRIC